jgi:hypothetical protein
MSNKDLITSEMIRMRIGSDVGIFYIIGEKEKKS